MAEFSKIQWTTHTFNPWIGCTKVSQGCKHCYAETLMDKRWGKVEWGPAGTRVRTMPENWSKVRKWNKQAEAAGVHHRVFCSSLADVFEDHPTIQAEWRRDLWNLVETTPNLDWLLLTKRPENIIGMTPYHWNFTGTPGYRGWPNNVWVGTSVEDQATADERIPKLLEIPAIVRFLSVEPLIAPVDITGRTLDTFWMNDVQDPIFPTDRGYNGLQWVIVGGESGNEARRFHLEWAASIIEDCGLAGVPVFMKQLGSNPFFNGGIYPCQDKKGGDMEEWPVELRVRQFPVVEVGP